MKNQESTVSVLSDGSFLYEGSVSGSSKGPKRISRKTNESTASRRSLSRKSSDRSQEKPEVNSFFIKMSSLQLPSQNSQASTRNNLLQREETRNQKKRSPTPVPGYLSRKRQKAKEKQQQSQELNTEIMLAQVQTRYTEQQEKVRKHQKRIEQLEKQIKVKINKINEISDLLVHSEQKVKDMAMKMKEIQVVAYSHQNSLTQTKTKLEKLKNTIKINRFSQLQTDNMKLRKEKDRLSKKVEQLTFDNKNLDERCIFLEKQIYVLKKKHEPFSLKQAKNGQANQTLEKTLASRDAYIKKLEDKVNKAEIQLSFMNRKKLEEIQQWKVKKDQEINRLRQRLINMNKELKEKRLENEEMKGSISLDIAPVSLIQNKAMSRRTSIMSSDTWATHEDIFCLSLSPEHFDQ